MRAAALLLALAALLSLALSGAAQRVVIEPNAGPDPCSNAAIFMAANAVDILDARSGRVEKAFSSARHAFPDPDRVCVCRDRFLAGIGKYCQTTSEFYQYWYKLCYESSTTYDFARCRSN